MGDGFEGRGSRVAVRDFGQDSRNSTISYGPRLPLGVLRRMPGRRRPRDGVFKDFIENYKADHVAKWVAGLIGQSTSLRSSFGFNLAKA